MLRPLAEIYPPLAIAITLAPGLAAQDRRPVLRVVHAMGTSLRLSILGRDRQSALAASEAAIRRVAAVEARLSTWTASSELAQLNRQPVGRPRTVSVELTRDLRAALRWSRATRGTFDPGVGALVDAWDLRGRGRVPASTELARLCSAGGILGLHLTAGRATRTEATLRFEEGGFAKGRALDAALATLRQLDVEAVLNFGGQVAHLGGQQVWLAIADPRMRNRTIGEIAIRTGSIATSGNSQRAITVEGKRYSHILDPRSGRPCRDFGSLTVLAPTATAADCLSTGLYVQGPDRALAFAAHSPGVEVFVAEFRGTGIRLRASSGLRGHIRAAGSRPITFPRSSLK